MKLSDLRPCDNCGQKIAPMFYIVDVSLAFLSPNAANQVLGLYQYFQGRSLALAEAFAPESDDAVVIAAEKDASLRTRLFICQTCHLERPLDLPLIIERRSQAEKNAAKAERGPALRDAVEDC